MAREQALVIREEELVGRAKAFDTWQQQLKDEIEKRLTGGH